MQVGEDPKWIDLVGRSLPYSMTSAGACSCLHSKVLDKQLGVNINKKLGIEARHGHRFGFCLEVFFFSKLLWKSENIFVLKEKQSSFQTLNFGCASCPFSQHDKNKPPLNDFFPNIRVVSIFECLAHCLQFMEFGELANTRVTSSGCEKSSRAPGAERSR